MTKICYLNSNHVFLRLIHVFINYLQLTHEIYLSFNWNPSLETCGVLLDLSKAFDRVWHFELLFKLKQNGVGWNLFQLITSFLSGTFQRVMLNGQSPDWEAIRAGERQGSILGPLFLLKQTI